MLITEILVPGLLFFTACYAYQECVDPPLAPTNETWVQTYFYINQNQANNLNKSLSTRLSVSVLRVHFITCDRQPPVVFGCHFRIC